MQSQDLEVLSALGIWLAAGKTTFLCTIVKTYGSSPRPAGSLLALNEDAGLVGSLSGGCIEDDLIDGLRSGRISIVEPTLMAFGVSAEDVERLGLPCGGTLLIMVERFDPIASDRELVSGLVSALRSGQSVTRHVVEGQRTPRSFSASDARPGIHFRGSETGASEIRHTLGPSVHLFLIGAGIVSQYLAEMALSLDFRVTVCDPRDDVRSQWRVPATTCIGGMPDDAVRAHASDPMSAIIALTHNPRIDDMGLMQALESKAFYVGAMGSKASSAARKDRLRMVGVTETALDRLYAPVGLQIGSKTPAEIAISIIAHVIQVADVHNAKTRRSGSAQSEEAAPSELAISSP